MNKWSWLYSTMRNIFFKTVLEYSEPHGRNNCDNNKKCTNKNFPKSPFLPTWALGLSAQTNFISKGDKTHSLETTIAWMLPSTLHRILNKLVTCKFPKTKISKQKEEKENQKQRKRKFWTICLMISDGREAIQQYFLWLCWWHW